ncbi:ferrodoxin reductase-like protein [Plasmodium ovale wallikeri]|uniref:Ferrodoxin reductase-like protein n=1 Tax=Plasmodium ovale wallikeri TaxID=864142 RepID=A0A1A8YIE5_PLAOA|nr:ferrodoxin reductase-like protein [Plasmodium ovale wallikeri]
MPLHRDATSPRCHFTAPPLHRAATPPRRHFTALPLHHHPAGEPINVCHYNVAIQQGRIAAHNMLSKEKKVYNFIPFFNTNIFGKNFRYSGFVKNHDKIIYEGDVSKHNFVAYFVKNDKVASILTLGNNKMAALNECLSKSKVPKVYELEAGLKNSDSMIASLKV